MSTQTSANWLGVSPEEMSERIERDETQADSPAIDARAQRRHNQCFMIIISMLIAAQMKRTNGF